MWLSLFAHLDTFSGARLMKLICHLVLGCLSVINSISTGRCLLPKASEQFALGLGCCVWPMSSLVVSFSVRRLPMRMAVCFSLRIHRLACLAGVKTLHSLSLSRLYPHIRASAVKSPATISSSGIILCDPPYVVLLVSHSSTFCGNKYRPIDVWYLH